MCGACASGSTPTVAVKDPKAPPPRSAYYDSHMRHERSLPTRLLVGAWKLTVVVVVVVAPISYFSILVSRAVKGLGHQEHDGSHTQEYQRQLAQRQVGVPLGLNLTRPVEPFWQAYRELLLFDGAVVTTTTTTGQHEGEESSKNEDEWFADVNADTILIAEMWSKVEKPALTEIEDDDHHHRKVEDRDYDRAFHGNKVLSSAAYQRIEGEIHARTAVLRNALVEFGRFSDERARMVPEFLRKGTMWQRGDGKTVGGTGLSEQDLKQLGPLLNPSNNNTNNTTTTTKLTPNININTNINNRTILLLEDVATYDNETAAAVARTAEGLMKELVRQHAVLLERFELHDGPSALTQLCRVTLPGARMAESRFIKKLLRASEHSEAAARWKEEKRGLAIGALRDRICELDAMRADMRKAVTWLEDRFQTQSLFSEGEEGQKYLEMTKVRDGVSGKRRSVPELLLWVQSAVELLGAWSTVLMDVEEGVLIALRKREIAVEKEEKKKTKELVARKSDDDDVNVGGSGTTTDAFNYDRSWHTWKQRNCGSTSCYDETTLLTRLRYFVAGEKPLAGDAWDERDHLSGWDVKIWKGIYEKACCEHGTLAKTLKYGEKTPEFPVEAAVAHNEL
ncbi:hypothetical protein MGN70_001639 [Eutypa lata]|nr:hypothetical protein MGN70_001639 [Eutypa lata]